MIEQQLGFSLESFLRGIVGISTVLGVAYLMSYDRKRVDWKLVGGGLFMQFVFALAVLYVPVVGIVLEWVGKAFIKLMDFTQSGVAFLLGPLVTKSEGFIFLLNSLPVVIFFSALVSLFYYWGIIQRVVGGFSWLLRRFMNISGAEGLVASGNVFLGMTESPVLIKNYLPAMNRSEIFLVMVSGMGTIAGTVMGTYIGMLAGGDPVSRVLFAKHLLSASLMAAPGSIVLAKILCPQTEKVDDRLVKMEKVGQHSTVLDALAAGTSTGVRLMVNIAAMLLVFIAMVALANYILEGVIGRYTGLNDWIVSITGGKAQGLTFQFILGVILSPFMWLIGVPYQDVLLVGSLLGQKTILNEFVAYFQLQEWKDAGLFLYQKSILMSTLDSTDALFRFSGGDARKLLNILDLIEQATPDGQPVVINDKNVTDSLQENPAAYDRNGEMHYDIISAFIKSVLASNPDADLYSLARMVAGGEDPAFIARRLVILAAEDIGLANPNALLLANATFDALQKIGWPEGRIILSECAIYLANSPKSNSAYLAIDSALETVRQTGDLPVPLHLRNAPTKLMSELGYGDGYKYAHDFTGHFVEQQYLPDSIDGTRFWTPADNPSEAKMAARQAENHVNAKKCNS